MWIILDFFYLALLLFGIPYLLWRMWQDKRYAEIFRDRLGAVPPRTDPRPCIWIHAVSVGEVKLAAALTKEIDTQLPGHQIAVSSTTVQGLELARKMLADRIVFPSPLDFSCVVRRNLRNLHPCCLVLVELELWPNLLLHAKRLGVPVVVVNCRITERSARGYSLLDAFVPGFLPGLGVRVFCVQNEIYADRLRRLGIPAHCVRVTGNMKYDGLRTSVEETRQAALRSQFGLNAQNLVLVAASTHADEEAQLCEIFPTIARQFPSARLIIVPRHVERADEIAKIVSKAGLRPVRKTELTAHLTLSDADWRTVLIGDTMGELIDIMSLATVVFVGKSISPQNRGGHNMLEPAALAKPVLFGPYVANFQAEAEFLLNHGAALQVRGKIALRDACLELFRSPHLREELGQKAAGLIAQNQGATQKNVAVIKEILTAKKNALS